eukprot:CAMPEP_0113857190 /NCGR_PEP_ID=MMETSP0372-20130328/9935_1 /TAXON_ID=340204 /ORGANISM="Lankesteria abbotti" /LENGTH=150 /DNA_ID=CAMNT_0000832837 /DNA_START=366 /DNA_END=814 /DNA_ORIENTATION=- /assembly_acc=CAM_ASM_000359
MPFRNVTKPYKSGYLSISGGENIPPVMFSPPRNSDTETTDTELSIEYRLMRGWLSKTETLTIGSLYDDKIPVYTFDKGEVKPIRKLPLELNKMHGTQVVATSAECYTFRPFNGALDQRAVAVILASFSVGAASGRFETTFIQPAWCDFQR